VPGLVAGLDAGEAFAEARSRPADGFKDWRNSYNRVTVADAELPEHPKCPHCGSEDTRLMSPFGSVLANAQFYCEDCRTTFEFMKWEHELDE
jgi:hypothetical protein